MHAHTTVEASIPNPALERFTVLIGNWSTIGTHPQVPDATFHGHTSFAWLEGGAFLIMHSSIEEPDIPTGIVIIGSDNVAGTFFMLYFDERGVSRKYDVSLEGNTWKWWRDSPDFAHPIGGVVRATPASATGVRPRDHAIGTHRCAPKIGAFPRRLGANASRAGASGMRSVSSHPGDGTHRRLQ